ncbi:MULTISPECIES: methyltransferase [unclassified Streptosporangium]|uniref:methyltransferase n=1 Tax=unclassified Streptosporangium TaxID=2632669 RepID=UPI002E27EAFE|nr:MULTISPECIES: methyltransferase [unclassified Streptosporangium]
MTTQTSRITGPAEIIQLGKTAFCTAKVLLSALELRVFAVLAEQPLTEPQLRERLGLHPRASRDFFDTLVALGLLVREGERYSNTPVTGRFLDPGEPAYVGGFLERSDRILYPAWGDLTEALRTGKPRVDNAFREMLEDPARLSSYLGMMDALSTMLAPLIANSFDWKSVKTYADIGGARGNLVSRVAREHEHLDVHVFDLPPMEKAFHAHTELLGVADRATFHPGDFFADPLPEADVLTIGHVLHNWSPAERRVLVEKAFQAVHPGGALIVYDRMLADEPTDPENLVISLDMLLTTEGGSEYPVGECREWMEEAGFTVESVKPLGDHDTLIVARKAS